jgi:carboxypeptidase family protein
VTDSSGAVIPGVKITVTDTDTGVACDTKSNELGYYTAPLLKPGNYVVAAEKPGFRSSVQGGFQLLGLPQATFDFKMEVGQSNQEISIKTVELENVQGQSASGVTIGENKGGGNASDRIACGEIRK